MGLYSVCCVYMLYGDTCSLNYNTLYVLHFLVHRVILFGHVSYHLSLLPLSYTHMHVYHNVAIIESS